MLTPLFLRGKSPEKTKEWVTGTFSKRVVTCRTKRQFLLLVTEFLFHETCVLLPLSWSHFFFVSLRLLNTAHPNNFFFFSEADRRKHISPQETGDVLSLRRQQLKFRYYTDANGTRNFTKATESTKMTVIRTFWRAGFNTRPVCVGSVVRGLSYKMYIEECHTIAVRFTKNYVFF
jgi:hypothetical protein